MKNLPTTNYQPPSTTFIARLGEKHTRRGGTTVQNNHNTLINKSGAGFTLVETLIAITVLLTAVAGPLTIASRSLISAHFARDQVTAFYLAQEATELIRNKRDNNALASVLWLSGLEECIGQSCSVNGTSDIDDPNTIETCSVSCPVLREDTASGLYGYDPSWNASRFIRTVRVTEINPTEANISVTISWNTGPLAKSFTINENILDWQ